MRHRSQGMSIEVTVLIRQSFDGLDLWHCCFSASRRLCEAEHPSGGGYCGLLRILENKGRGDKYFSLRPIGWAVTE